MNRYLIVQHIIYGTYSVPIIEKTDLVELLKGNCEHIFDTVEGTQFVPGRNAWEPVKKEKRAE